MAMMKSEQGSVVKISATMKKLLDAAAYEEDVSQSEYIRRRITEEIRDNALAHYFPYRWSASPTAITTKVRMSPRLSTAINERMEYLHSHPNDKGWRPTCWAEYLRAVLEHYLDVAAYADKAKARAEKAAATRAAHAAERAEKANKKKAGA